MRDPSTAPRLVDLDKIAAIARDEDGMNGDFVLVTRPWLTTVEQELRAGRAAMAMLDANAAVAGVVDQIGSRP